MKLIISYAAMILIVLLYTGCNKNNPTQPPVQDNSNYFPNTNNTYYKCSINLTNAQGTINTGTKSTTYFGTTVSGGTTYQKQTDTLFTGNIASSTNISYFRKDGTGVYYFFDTSGISTFIPSQYLVALSISSELHLLSSPLSDGLNWQVYKLGVAILNYNFVDIEASYLGKENVILNLSSGQVTVNAAKIKYVLTLQIPNPNNPLAAPAKSTLTAYGWYAADIGPVQWQGNSAVLNGFSGGGITLGDTTNNVTQTLTYYNIK
jgi:hypothetical protein